MKTFNVSFEEMLVHTVRVGTENPDDEGGGLKYDDEFFTTNLNKAKDYLTRHYFAYIVSETKRVIVAQNNDGTKNVFIVGNRIEE